jgi:hypothetical protein
LPEIFRTHQLSILPVTRRDYLIGPFETHKRIYYSKVEQIQIEIPSLETLDAKNLYSEAAALSFAFNSGIINDIMNSANVRFTVSGRMGSGDFAFSIENSQHPECLIPVEVNHSQIEIDAGFESPDAFVVCEAKIQAPEDLLIRQLYYPYRLWRTKISKPVIPMFLAFSNDVFRIFLCEFADEQNYNSLTIRDYREYKIADEEISLQDIIGTWRSAVVAEEPDAPFPQADSFHRVMDLLSVLHEEELTQSEVTLKYEFVPRQTDYYVAACIYLGLVERFPSPNDETGYRLTAEARCFMSLPCKQKRLALMKRVFERSVFYGAFRLFVDTSNLPDKQAVCEIMESTNFKNPISGSTIPRRASTVIGWLKWMIQIAVTE